MCCDCARVAPVAGSDPIGVGVNGAAIHHERSPLRVFSAAGAEVLMPFRKVRLDIGDLDQMNPPASLTSPAAHHLLGPPHIVNSTGAPSTKIESTSPGASRIASRLDS